jgi:hypothetical protein
VVSCRQDPLGKDKEEWRAVVNTVMNLPVPYDLRQDVKYITHLVVRWNTCCFHIQSNENEYI